MTQAQIDALVSQWLNKALDESEDIRSVGTPLSDDARESLQYGLSDQFDAAHEALLAGNNLKASDEADDLLQAAGLPPMDHSSEDFSRLCKRLLRAKIEFLKIESERWDGDYRDDLHRGGDVMTVPPPSPPVKSPPLSTVIDKYLLAVPRPARTAEPLRQEFRRFVVTIGGDRPIAEVTKADCVRYKESLQSGRGLSLVTCHRHITSTDAFFRWAMSHGYLPEGTSLMRGLAPGKRLARKQALKRRPFTDGELLAVFGSEEFVRQRTERPERYWLVLILLFTCCRREEAGQLYLKDISESDGVPYFHIIDGEKDQTLKNDGSRRKVPIHSGLVKLGFLEYAASIKKAGHVRLFPQFDHKGTNGYADPVGKWFARLLTSIGLTDPRVVIHSLRHGGITKLHGAGVPGNIIEVLVGHSAGNVHGQYVHRELISMKTLQEGLEKLQYPEVVAALLKAK